MNKRFFRTVLSAAVLALLCSCGEDELLTLPENDSNNTAYVVSEPSFLLVVDGVSYLIATNGIVTNTNGEVVGAADINAGLVIAMDQTIIAQGVDFSTLDVIQPTVVLSTAWVFSADKNYVIYPNGVVTDANGTVIGSMVFAPDPATGELSTIGSIVGLDGITIFENIDISQLKVYEANVAPAPESSASINPPASSSEGTNPSLSSESVQPGLSSSGTTPKSSASIKSSSSSAKSSSSSVKSSSSNGNSSTYQIKYINGGKSGSGYASRYWDCCKPHCAWPEHGGTASTCDAKGNKISDKSASSMCDGGNAGICRSQFPIAINDTLAFAFAATPGGESNCGKCFDLAFTGKGKYATDNHTKLKGKHLIVMSNNVGYDVAGGQFDVMIPGGGYGIFNGCSQRMGWGSQGAQYGGLLTECEESSGYKASTYKKCLTEKCNSSFSSDPEAKEGCLFLANWMNAAGNPLVEYKEVECPKELKDRF